MAPPLSPFADSLFGLSLPAPGEINSHVAHTKPVWWSLHMDAHEIWCCDLDQGTYLGRSIPCPPVLCSVRKIHLRPQVLRPTSPRNILPILNQVCVRNWWVLGLTDFKNEAADPCGTVKTRVTLEISSGRW
nr:embryonic stem cell-related gene protein-like [Gorilla gorilla gorilla]